MNLLLCLFGISTCFLAGAVAHEAVIGGRDVQVDTEEFLYMVSVQINRHVCGGCIIDVRFVLTAAHCLLNQTRGLIGRNVSVLAKVKNTHVPDEALRFPVDIVYFPKDYRQEPSVNYRDIAILRLKDSFRSESNLWRLLLPKDGLARGLLASIIGFGWNSVHFKKKSIIGYSNGHLHIAEANILPVSQCESAYGANLDNSYLCARTRRNGTHIAGACVGDAGGPLVQHGFVVGILSEISPDCDETVKPAVYTRVAVFRKIIATIILYHRHRNMTELYIPSNS